MCFALIMLRPNHKGALMFRFRRVSVCVLFLFGAFGVALAQDKANDAVERRINGLIKQMTLQEKAGQLSQYDSMSPQITELLKKGEVGSLLNVIGAENTNAA